MKIILLIVGLLFSMAAFAEKITQIDYIDNRIKTKFDIVPEWLKEEGVAIKLQFDEGEVQQATVLEYDGDRSLVFQVDDVTTLNSGEKFRLLFQPREQVQPPYSVLIPGMVWVEKKKGLFWTADDVSYTLNQDGVRSYMETELKGVDQERYDTLGAALSTFETNKIIYASASTPILLVGGYHYLVENKKLVKREETMTEDEKQKIEQKRDLWEGVFLIGCLVMAQMPGQDEYAALLNKISTATPVGRHDAGAAASPAQEENLHISFAGDMGSVGLKLKIAF